MGVIVILFGQDIIVMLFGDKQSISIYLLLLVLHICYCDTVRSVVVILFVKL